MAKYTGYDAVVYVEVEGEFVKVAAQRNATLTRSMETVDVTDKDGNNWQSFLAGIRSWTLDCDGLVTMTDAGYGYLETAYANRAAVNVRLITPSGETYTGEALLTELSNDAPQDDAFSFAASFQGSGALVKAD